MAFGNIDLTAVLIIMVVFAGMCILGIAIVFGAIRRRNMEMEVYKKAIEKGLPVPEFRTPRTPLRTLKGALIWLAVGIGLFLILLTSAESDGLAVSAIPILIGIALLISYYIEKKSDNGSNKSEPPVL